MRGYSKRNRDRRRAAGLCINSNNHGPATHGVLCAACRATHRGCEAARTTTGTTAR